MSSLKRGVRCTVHDDGAVWMHLDVEIPPDILSKSKVLMDAVLSEADDSIARDFTLAAPKEWLQAWVACYCGGEQRLSCADTGDLINCLLVCSYFWPAASIALTRFMELSCPYAAAVFSATRVLDSTLLPFNHIVSSCSLPSCVLLDMYH
jgi:hypothetical protein